MSGRPAEPTAAEAAAVLDAIRSHDGAITKPELVAKTALCDRVIRECVHQLVLAGHPITTNRSTGGYEFTRDVGKIEAEHARLQSHGKSILARASALAKNHLDPQADLFR